MIAAFAEMERDSISDRTQMTMADRAERGLCNGTNPLGYRTGDDGHLEINDDEAGIVRLIFDLFERSGSAGRTLSELANRGIMQPRRTTVSGRVKGGRVFQKQAVLRILRNPAYVGTIEWGSARREKCHPAIIGDEQFARVGQRLQETLARRTNFRQSGKRSYLLSGLLRCTCGNHMVGASYRGRSKGYRYSSCALRAHEGTGASCQAPRIPADDLERAVIARLIDIGNRDEARRSIIEAAATLVNGRRGDLESQEAILRQRMLTNKSERAKLVDVLKVGGAAMLHTVQDELNGLEAEWKQLGASLDRITEEQEPLEEAEAAARVFLESWGGIGDVFAAAEPEELRQVLQHYVEVGVEDAPLATQVPSLGRLAPFRLFKHRREDLTATTHRWQPNPVRGPGERRSREGDIHRGVTGVRRRNFGHLLVHGDGVAGRRAKLAASQPDGDAVVVVSEGSRVMQPADGRDDFAVFLQWLE
jgi:hypothetical protein